MNENQYHPELHVNEEPRNDFMDTGIGFGFMFGICAVIFIVGVVIKQMM